MPHSHHSHSGQFCKHASGTLEDVVLQAIRHGFETYGLTEHVPRYRPEDLYPEEAGISPADLRVQFDAFLAEAHRLKEKYADSITLLVGLETESITALDVRNLGALLDAHAGRVEYLVGSVHHVNGIPVDFDRETYLRALSSFRGADDSPDGAMERFLCAYFDAQHELITAFHPELIGHFDLCRLYTPSLRFAHYPAVVERIKRNVDLATGYGAVFELNAAAFRKGWDGPYPGQDIVEIILSAGGRFVLSDDSHGPHAVGLNYHRIPEYARRVGITELWVLARSEEPVSHTGRHVVPRRVPGAWLEHPFWSKSADAPEA